ncbi:hypothetical protein BD413DRAFT_131497 [Trametes elegans]|nr:hypothetical protein BD413DRAFT_131497 [Trametes elegans]
MQLCSLRSIPACICDSSRTLHDTLGPESLLRVRPEGGKQDGQTIGLNSDKCSGRETKLGAQTPQPTFTQHFTQPANQPSPNRTVNLPNGSWKRVVWFAVLVSPISRLFSNALLSAKHTQTSVVLVRADGTSLRPPARSLVCLTSNTQRSSAVS